MASLSHILRSNVVFQGHRPHLISLSSLTRTVSQFPRHYGQSTTSTPAFTHNPSRAKADNAGARRRRPVDGTAEQRFLAALTEKRVVESQAALRDTWTYPRSWLGDPASPGRVWKPRPSREGRPGAPQHVDDFQWEGAMLFVDVANCVKTVKTRIPSGLFSGPAFVLQQISRLPAVRGCRVFAVVEGTDRDRLAPPSVHVIRADDVQGQRDLGDDALVEHIDLAIHHGIEAERCVLITSDSGLLSRARPGVLTRTPWWLRGQLVALDQLEWGDSTPWTSEDMETFNEQMKGRTERKRRAKPSWKAYYERLDRLAQESSV